MNEAEIDVIVAQALVKAEIFFKQVYEENLEDFEVLLRDKGATQQEVESMLAYQRGVMRTEIPKHLQEIEDAIRRGGIATLH
jgi:hypothetical protein